VKVYVWKAVIAARAIQAAAAFFLLVGMVEAMTEDGVQLTCGGNRHCAVSVLTLLPSLAMIGLLALGVGVLMEAICRIRE